MKTSCKKDGSFTLGERPTGVLEGCENMEKWIHMARGWPTAAIEMYYLDLPSGKNLLFHFRE